MNQREEQKKQTMHRISEVAWDLAVDKNFDNVSIQEIAKKAGVSVSLIYYHFGNKEAILDYDYSLFDEKLEAWYKDTAPCTAEEKLTALMTLYCRGVEQLGIRVVKEIFKIQMNGKSSYATDPDGYFYRSVQEALEEITELQEDVPAAYMMLCCIRGLVYDWVCRNGDFSLPEKAAEIIPFLMNKNVRK